MRRGRRQIELNPQKRPVPIGVLTEIAKILYRRKRFGYHFSRSFSDELIAHVAREL
jgi:hypothetical protein